jgi:hypothetical protein
MSDTPETDRIVRNAAIADHPPTRLAATLTVKCEKLERERDEARAELEEYRSIAENIGATKAVSERDKAVAERDEARFLLKEAQSALDAIHLEVGGWIKIMKENTD